MPWSMVGGEIMVRREPTLRLVSRSSRCCFFDCWTVAYKFLVWFLGEENEKMLCLSGDDLTMVKYSWCRFLKAVKWRKSNRLRTGNSGTYTNSPNLVEIGAYGAIVVVPSGGVACALTWWSTYFSCHVMQQRLLGLHWKVSTAISPAPRSRLSQHRRCSKHNTSSEGKLVWIRWRTLRTLSGNSSDYRILKILLFSVRPKPEENLNLEKMKYHFLQIFFSKLGLTFRKMCFHSIHSF